MNRREADALDVAFCRHLLASIHKDVKAARPNVNLRKDAWVAGPMFRDHYEFHGPGDFFWDGRAANAYEARYKGWAAWLRKQGVEGYVN